jgi:cytosine deaminase
MHLAIAQAKAALAINEIPVGVVIVNPQKEVIAVSHNQSEKLNNATSHAELLAINNACSKLQEKYLIGCEIYITLEPCIMCLAAISYSKIAKIFYGANNAKYGAFSNNINLAMNGGSYFIPEIYPGILQKEASDLLEIFFQDKRRQQLNILQNTLSSK